MSKVEMRLHLPEIPRLAAVIIAMAMLGAVLLAYTFTPNRSASADEVDLAKELPTHFGDWTEKKSPFVQVALATGTEPNIDQPYDQTVMRAYQNSKGEIIYLAVAWGREQQQEVKIHRPDLCYVAQGFRISSLNSSSINVSESNTSVSGKHMVAVSGGRSEAVSYWMRIGSIYSEDAVDTRLHILAEGLKGRMVDGILVRASMPIRTPEEAEAAWPIVDEFLKRLVMSSNDSVKVMLIGR